MLNEKELFQLAARELIRIFGRKYLQDNYRNTCKAFGFVNENTYQLFIGIKSSDDLPDREANDHGWVVYGKIFVDAYTGEIKLAEYELE